MPPLYTLCRGALLSGLLIAVGTGCAQESAPNLAVPVDAVDSIIREFETHDIIAIRIGSSEEGHAFRMSLLRTPEFPAVVDDIVVEFGASRYQEIIDSFTSGELVPYEELKKVWQQTTQPHPVSDPPIYEEFFRAVREVNAALPKEDQLRVVLAESPIDWNLIEDYEDLLPWLQGRLVFEAEVVEQEVLERGRKALLLSGGLHFANDSLLIRSIKARGTSILKIWTVYEDLEGLQPSIRSWPIPSLAFVRDTVLGTPDIRSSYNALNLPPGPFEEQFDAVLYLGPPSDFTDAQIAPELCSDQEYLDMRIPRLRIAAEAGATFLEDFTDYCDDVLGR